MDKRLKWPMLILILMLCLSCRKCEAADIDISAIIQIESKGKPYALGKDGEIGLMQIRPIVLMEWYNNVGMFGTGYKIPGDMWSPIVYENNYKKADLFTPSVNVKIGTWYLERIRDHYCKVWNIPPTIEHIIIGYNWGIGNLKKWYRAGADWDKLPKTTKKYIKKYRRLTNE